LRREPRRLEEIEDHEEEQIRSLFVSFDCLRAFVANVLID